MTRRGFLGLVTSCSALLFSGCGLFGGNSYRFRMTVEVDTPEGLKSGSSVYEIKAADRASLLPEEGVRSIEQHGEAVVVDLEQGPIFVLMKFNDARLSGFAEMSMAALDPEFQNMTNSVESAARLSGWSDATGEVPRENWPMMVRFGDINDPKTVEPVDPGAIGVKRILLETTNDGVTVGIKEMLGWLSNGGRTLNPNGKPTITPAFSGTIRQREFSTEIPQ